VLSALSAPAINSVELAKAWSEFVEEAGKESALQRRRASLCVGLLLGLLQDVLRLRVGGEPQLASAAERKTLETLSARLEIEPLLAVLERCLEGEFQIDRRVQLVLILEALSDALGQRLGVKPGA
jgi:DNA polymerase-3 subunit delta'